MKLGATLPLLFALSASSFAFAQMGNMKNMEMKEMKGMNVKDTNGMDMKKCMDMKGMNMKAMKGMEGMEMKDIDAKHCQKMMKGMDKKQKGSEALVHQADGVVKVVDPINSKVTLDHGAIKSLGWPAMTMAFGVKDKALLEKLVAGHTVHVEFTKQGADYVITSVK